MCFELGIKSMSSWHGTAINISGGQCAREENDSIRFDSVSNLIRFDSFHYNFA